VGHAALGVLEYNTGPEYDDDNPDDPFQIGPLLDSSVEPRNLNLSSSNRSMEEAREVSMGFRGEYRAFLESHSSKYETVLKTIAQKNQKDVTRKK